MEYICARVTVQPPIDNLHHRIEARQLPGFGRLSDSRWRLGAAGYRGRNRGEICQRVIPEVVVNVLDLVRSDVMELFSGWLGCQYQEERRSRIMSKI